MVAPDALESNLLSIRRPDGKLSRDRIGVQRVDVAAIGIHHADPTAVEERDESTVRRPSWDVGREIWLN
jgi:hypothetical protein